MEASGDKRTVSVGVPTFNRVAQLRRAVESVLAQNHSDLELVISDNASTDGTEEFCRELCARDPRVRYIRQPANRGMTANYMEALRHARGEFFMWLSDDDWLDAAYIAECLKVLAAQPAYASVSGSGKYHRGEEVQFENEGDLDQETGAARVLAYLQHVGRNGSFYGVMRRAELSELTLQNTLGGDWLLVAEVAFRGKIKVLKHVFINRSIEGNSENLQRLAKSFGIHRLAALNPFFTIAATIFNDIAWRAPVYHTIGRRARWSLARRAAGIVLARHGCPYVLIRLHEYRIPAAAFTIALVRRMFGRNRLPHV